MLNNFIYAKTKALFEEQLNKGNILDEAIVFIEDTKEIWNHGTYFGHNADFEYLEDKLQKQESLLNVLANYNIEKPEGDHSVSLENIPSLVRLTGVCLEGNDYSVTVKQGETVDIENQGLASVSLTGNVLTFTETGGILDECDIWITEYDTPILDMYAREPKPTSMFIGNDTEEHWRNIQLAYESGIACGPARFSTDKFDIKGTYLCVTPWNNEESSSDDWMVTMIGHDNSASLDMPDSIFQFNIYDGGENVGNITQIPLSNVKTQFKTINGESVVGTGNIVIEGGADWNAQEGEAGYIENKPFERKNIEPFISNNEVVYENLDNTDVYIQCDDTIYLFPYGYDDNTSFIETEKEIHTGMDFVIKARRYEYEMRIQSLTSILDVNDIPKYITVFYVDRKLNQSDIDDTVLKITPQSLSDDDKNQALANLGISTPDWNAQQGEAGYIENKPCYVNLDNGRRITLDNANITLSSDNNWYEKIIIPIGEYHQISLYFYDINGNLTHYVLTEGQSVFDSHFGCKFTAVLNEYDSCDLLLTDFGDPKEYVDTIFVETKLVYEYNNVIVQKLDSTYLPDTIIKTTPQTLSDTDKNQALANLGVDPVVWKYLCNPFIVKQGSKFPDELLAEGVELDSKYHIPAMYRIFIEDETKVNSNASKGSTITPAHVYYRTMEGPAYSSSGEFVEASWYIDGSIDIHYSV